MAFALARYDGAMTSSAEVPAGVHRRLAHACLQFIANTADVRILHIKGEALHPDLADGRSAPSDCDVLVDPARVMDYQQALTQLGWELYTRFEYGSIFGHAATHYNPRWGTVDVHRSFPGFDLSPQEVFDQLWEEHSSVELGSVECAVPSLRHQRIIMLAHAARDPFGRGVFDVEASWTTAPDEVKQEIDELAESLGARVALAFATDREDRASGLPGEHLWRALSSNANSSEIWRARVKESVRQGPRALLRTLATATHVNPDHLALKLGRKPTRADLRAEQRERVRRGWHAVRAKFKRS